MSSSPLKIFGAPGRYLQGAGALAAMGEHLAPLGASAALVADRMVLDLFGARIVATCASAGIACHPVVFSGDITPDEIDRLVGVARPLRPQFVIGCGGGRGVDAGKAVAHQLGCRVVTIPTVASNDAPTSKIYVLYDEHHRLLRVGHLPANPDVVVVDTDIIVTAPVRFFTAGIGDAIVKAFEVAQCMAATGSRNIFGGRPLHAAGALADLCYATLREFAEPALQAVHERRVTDAVERVVEATVFHSGLGFESGGLSISHAMTRGLSAVRDTRDALHGHQVAYALLVQLTLEGRSEAFMDDIAGFHRRVALPLSLADLGMQRPTADELMTIAQGTMTAPHVRHFERIVSADDIVGAMRRVESRAGG